MKQRRRIYYTDTQKALMWERWRTTAATGCRCGGLMHYQPLFASVAAATAARSASR